MEELECDYLATGHYAEIHPLENGGHGIFTSEDSMKDQTYFLFTISPELLPKLLFPVGRLPKEKVRAIAREKNLPVFGKKIPQEYVLSAPGDTEVLLKAGNRTLKKVP